MLCCIPPQGEGVVDIVSLSGSHFCYSAGSVLIHVCRPVSLTSLQKGFLYPQLNVFCDLHSN